MTNRGVQRKGRQGEAEAAAALTAALGIPCCRSSEKYRPGSLAPDVSGLPGCHLEVKRCERLRLGPAMAQAIADCRGRVPVVMHRGNRQPWLVTMRLDDVRRFAVEIAASIPSPRF